MSEYTREEILKLIEENGGPEGLDLSGKDLSGIDLSREAIQKELTKVRKDDAGAKPVWFHAEIGSINLGKANLRSALLLNANLQEAFLLGANLQKADLTEANLQKAVLWVANFQEAQLAGANLRGAYLRDANLQTALLFKANLEEAYLGHANLRGAYLEKANLQRTNLQGADLRGAHFHPSILQGAYLTGAKRDWQAIPVTEGMLEVAFALTGIASALAGVLVSIGSFGLSFTAVLLFVISLSAAGSLTLYRTYLNQQGFSLDIRSVVLSPYGWLLLSSGGVWIVAVVLILQRLFGAGS